MDNDAFRRFVGDFFANLEIEADPGQIEDGLAGLEVDGCKLFLQMLDEDAILLYATLGPVPEIGAEEVLRELLSANSFFLATDGAAFALAPEGGPILLQKLIPLSDPPGPEDFAAEVDRFRATLADWRERLKDIPVTGVDDLRANPGGDMMMA